MMDHALDVSQPAFLMIRKDVNQNKMDVSTKLEDVNIAILLSSSIKLPQVV